MDRLLLAMKKEEFDLNFNIKKIGDIYLYWTNREIKFKDDTEVFIRVQGDNHVMAICKYKGITTSVKSPNYKYDIKLEILSFEDISTREIFSTYTVKAGAECGWLVNK